MEGETIMSTARHVMILASAGSGKTYALTNRFVRLLALGARPERIAALTFTRKAAGEFFDEILNKLAHAARDAGAAAQLAREVDRPELGRADFLRMLRDVTETMHRLRLGTLDSFFARIARAFPLELGLAGDLEILQEHAARLERQRVLQRMFTSSGELDTAQKEFIESFKRATFGRDEKRLGEQLDRFLDEYQETYLAAPEADCWGNPRRIWPTGCAWLEGKVDVPRAVHALRAWLERSAAEGAPRDKWEEFLGAIEQWTPGADLRDLEYVLEKVLAAWPEICGGRAELKFFRKAQTLDPASCAALEGLARHVIGGEVQRRLETTRGIHAVLHGYEAVYHDAVRRTGRLTFADVQRLLMPASGVPALTRDAGADGRLFVDYRLDSEIDHWLLDEFQDTSFGQWSVLRNLIDEAVQDESGARSFFCVGDVKQAIFTWREGDPRLFREIFNHYNAAASGAIVEEHLVRSWRSGPAVIEMVNAVFGRGEILATLFPGEAAVTWNREWRTHETAVSKHTGQAAWLLAEGEAGRWTRTLDLIREIKPLERGLTCAVLVQKNATAAALADFLRREGRLPALAEADLRIGVDNPVGGALVALMQAAAHPGDTLAWEHLRMSPLGAVLIEENLTTPEALTACVLGEIHAGGFERTVEEWGRKLEPKLARTDKFSRERVRQFAAAAERFDETGSRSVAEFIHFIERYTVRDIESEAAIRVMTIHKSKGLGFDVVILPDLEGTRLDSRREGLAIQKRADRSIEWVLELPPKMVWEQDAVLAGQVKAEEAEACYEAFSLLYVAMTRAKRAMYVITAPAGGSTSRNYTRLLAETLGATGGTVRVGALKCEGGWVTGDADWYTEIGMKEQRGEKVEMLPLLELATTQRAPRRIARRPSGEKTGRVNAAKLFKFEGRETTDFGTAVHELFAQVEWGDDEDAKQRAAGWAGYGRAGEEALACLQAPALREIFMRPSDGAEVWRERAFELVIDGAWTTGVFDRVIVEREKDGHVQRVRVVDFKTDRVGRDAQEDVERVVARYRGQMELYRRAAATLCGVRTDRVSCELVLTARARRIILARDT
jgi:ATP-dependent helicase/nuclease subunit A